MRNMLTAVGCPIERADMNACFHFFDIHQDDYISREDFAFAMELSPDELDEAVISAQDQVIKALNTTNKMKHNQLYCEMFRLINVNGDGILSFAEITNFFARMNIYLTPVESRKMMQLMDVHGKDRIEEDDFVSFMSNHARDASMLRRAFRVREASESVRRWLVRSTNPLGGAAAAPVEPKYWRDLRQNHENSRGASFPGFLSAPDIQHLLSVLAYSMSIAECKQMCLILAPTKSGRIHQPDLEAFMASSCRAFGELLALLERDMLKEVVDLYRELQGAGGGPSPSAEKKASLEKEFREIVKEIEHTVVASAGASLTAGKESGSSNSSSSSGVSDVVSVAQVKAGIQAYMQ